MSKSFLDFLEDSDVTLLEGKACQSQFKGGDLILRKDDKNSSLYIIKEGSVSVIDYLLDQEYEVNQLHEGDLFGDMSFVDEDFVSTSIVAINDVTVAIISKEDMENIVKDDPLFYGRFYLALAKLLSHRLRKMDRQLSYTVFG